MNAKHCTTHHHACDCREAKFEALEAENAELREMVIRMYQHCTIEKAEMTEAESDEWMTLAAALEEET